MRLIDYVKELERLVNENPEKAKKALALAGTKGLCPDCIYYVKNTNLCGFPYSDGIIIDANLEPCFDGIFQKMCSVDIFQDHDEKVQAAAFDEACKRYASILEKAR